MDGISSCFHQSDYRTNQHTALQEAHDGQNKIGRIGEGHCLGVPVVDTSPPQSAAKPLLVSFELSQITQPLPMPRTCLTRESQTEPYQDNFR